MSVEKIFAEKGERFFREKEKQVIKEIALRETVVIATGGGAVMDEENGMLEMRISDPALLYEATFLSKLPNTQTIISMSAKTIKPSSDDSFTVFSFAERIG